MRFCYVLLLGIVSVNASISSKTPQVSTVNYLDWSLAEIRSSYPSRLVSNRLLRIHNENDEERVFGIKSIPGAGTFSNYLTKQTLAKYLKKDKDIDVVFAKLKLKTAGGELFENPKILAWAKYVNDYNTKHPDKAKSMLPTLMKQYNHEALAKMLEAAKQVKSTKIVATKLQTEQMNMWKSASVSADELFKKYKLDGGAVNLLANPGINIWIRYADEFNPGKKLTHFDTLRAHYSDELLSQLLIEAIKVPSTEKLAMDLQKQQMRVWLDNTKSPEIVFTFLMLNKGVDNLLDNPQLKTWLEYADNFRTENPSTKKVNLIDLTTVTRLYQPC